MKIKVNIEYTIQMHNGFDWIDVHQNFDGSQPLEVFKKEIIKETTDDLATVDGIINEAIAEVTDSFKGTPERLKTINFSYTQETKQSE
jgi:hypothetical protein